MAEIEYPIERMQAAAAQINAAADAMMEELSYRLNQAESSAYSLRAANLRQAYMDYLNTWRKQVTSLADTWHELAQNLATAARQMETIDTGLAHAVAEETTAVTPGN
ncbi:MAG TPA: hypothetical protein VIG30_08325 [Ktedonobacterales bacterium]|jgi:uncharacterized protein YukE